jgi:dipeptidase E
VSPGTRQIVAIGDGGFLMDDTSGVQERFLLSLCRTQVLPFYLYEMKRDYAAAARQADLIYVGGGNTPAMLAVWREFGFEQALRSAYDDGTVLAGISAGGNCWFEHYVTDSVPGGGVRDGLGWLPGTFCPHLDSEAWRQPMLAAARGAAYGAGEHVMVHFVDESPREALRSAADKSVMCVRRGAHDHALEAWAPRALT